MDLSKKMAASLVCNCYMRQLGMGFMGAAMLRIVFWVTTFFLIATAIAVQPACRGFGDKPLHKVTIKVR
jgi:hypothetical protein